MQTDKKIIYWNSIETPFGTCIVMASDKGICWVGTPGASLEKGKKWVANKLNANEIVKTKENKILQRALQELKKYFEGDKITFTGPFDLQGTPFQMQVWHQMQAIPYGQTRTYGQLATLIGRPKAARAVGGGCNKNPIAILIPCHRVVGSTGSLTGYAGGLPTKNWLLSLEKKHYKTHL